MAKQYINYDDVPWYRRTGPASVFVLSGFFCFPPLLWTVCLLCLTGDIYFKKVGKDGYLTKWSSANKVAAAIILILQTVGLAIRFSGGLPTK
jgi:hypothetical protein